MYKYVVYADVNNKGKKNIFETPSWTEARRYVDKIKSGNYWGCYSQIEIIRTSR